MTSTPARPRDGSATRPPARIALMGAGLIGREHARLIAAHPQAQLVGIADLSAEARALARELDVPFFDDSERMLAQTSPDGAIVALPNTLHLPAGLACIARGIPVLVEKPVADTVAAAMSLVHAGEAAGVPILVGHHRRHSPDIQAARSAIARGELGPIVAVHGMCLVKKHERYYDADWRRRPGGGPLLINAIHDIDCLRCLCGDIDSVSAIASSAARGFEVEDTAAVVMQFRSGALGTFLLSDAVPSPYFWETASGQALYFPAQPANAFVIGGRNATLAVPAMDLWRHEGDGDWRDPLVRRHLAPERASCYVRQLDNLVAVIRGLAEPVVTGRDGAMTLAVTLAIERAARERRPVSVDEMFD